MANEKIPAALIKDAQDIQSATREARDLAAEVKELKSKVKTTEEFAAVKDAKKLLKAFEKQNPQHAELKKGVKVAQDALKETKEAQTAAEAASRLKDYKAAIEEVGRHMAEIILDKKMASDKDATADEV